jgi:predicted TPR repeat methyltransferase
MIVNLWKPVVIYGKFMGFVDRTEYILKQSENKRVLHVGCADYPVSEERIGNGNLLHVKITNVAKEVLGIDNSTKGIEILHKSGFNNAKVYDAENIEELGIRCELILAGDVLEHMNNPSGLLNGISSSLAPDGEFLIALPNACSWNILRYIKGLEPTHFDHCYSFTVKNIVELCRRYGLLPVELAFTAQPPQANEGNIFILIKKLLFKIFPRMAPSFIMKFRHEEGLIKREKFVWR